MWPCSNNAGNTTWRSSNSSESSLTGTSLQENKRLVTASVLPKRKTNKRTKQKQTFVPLNVHVRAQVSAESKEGRGGEGRGAKEDVVNFKINVSPSRGYMKLSNWRFYSFAASGWFWRKYAGETWQISEHKQGLCKRNQHQFSLNIFNMQSREKVMRIDKVITKGKLLWSFIKFSQLIPWGNVWRSVRRICTWILGQKVY